MLLVSLALAALILSLVPNSQDGLPPLAFIPHLGLCILMILYVCTFSHETYSITRARSDSWVFKTLYNPFIFLGVGKYLERNEWEKAEVLLSCLEADYDPHPTTADFDKYKGQLEVGEHIKRLEQRIPNVLEYAELLEMVKWHHNRLLELESNLKRNKNRKKYREEILAKIKAVQISMLEYEVLLASEKKRKTEAYKRIVLINLNKSLN